MSKFTRCCIRVVGVALALAGAAAMAEPHGANLSAASGQIAIGTLSVIGSPVISVAGASGNGTDATLGSTMGVAGSVWVVTGVAEVAGGTVELLLSAAGSAGKMSVKLAGKTVQTVGVSVGTTVQVLSETTGTVLVTSGKVLAFIPNAIGEALLSQARLPAH